MKIAFLGAGSTVFCKNILGDCLLAEGLPQFEIALLDLDIERLEESYTLICALRDKYKPAVTIKKYLASDSAQVEEGLAGASYVINAIQVVGYEPCTVIIEPFGTVVEVNASPETLIASASLSTEITRLPVTPSIRLPFSSRKSTIIPSIKLEILSTII